jgi:hypothetical protein
MSCASLPRLGLICMLPGSRRGFGLEATALTTTLKYHCDWCGLDDTLRRDGVPFPASSSVKARLCPTLSQACCILRRSVDVHSDAVRGENSVDFGSRRWGGPLCAESCLGSPGSCHTSNLVACSLRLSLVLTSRLIASRVSIIMRKRRLKTSLMFGLDGGLLLP